MRKRLRSLIWSKGNWLRVRGNVETNNFTRDLTMNVQEVQEVKKEIRKDLMPEGEKRVEFHAHTNMSTMDALPAVEDLVARAAAWGHKAVAITDHGNVQSFPMAIMLLVKLGLSPSSGWRLILSRTLCPLLTTKQM